MNKTVKATIPPKNQANFSPNHEVSGHRENKKNVKEKKNCSEEVE